MVLGNKYRDTYFQINYLYQQMDTIFKYILTTHITFIKVHNRTTQRA